MESAPVRPLPDGSDIRKVTEADAPQVAKALARSFYEDPVLGLWVNRDDSRRMQRLEQGFDLFVRRVWLPQDECYTTDRLIGGAMWMPPGTWHLSMLQQLRMLPAMLRAMDRAMPRLMAVLSVFEKKHPEEPHYYLPAIGVEPQWQGKGFGAALMRPILERCDREGLPAYLEATSPHNRALYERNGFEVVEEVTVKDSPPISRMWRRSRS